MKLVFLVITSALLLLLHCAKQINDPENIMNLQKTMPIISAADSIVKINGETIISLNTNSNSVDSLVAIFWSTDFGTIQNNGHTAHYFAPDNPGTAVIKAKIVHSSQTLEAEIAIQVYQQIIILKADDIVFDEKMTISINWQYFFNYIKAKKIKASLGVIGSSLEHNNPNYCAFLKELHRSGTFELWNHGYDHKINYLNRKGELAHEFCATPYDQQKEHLHRTQLLAREKLGIIMHTFGAPGNKKDHVTLKIIDESSDIKVWLFGLPASHKLVLERKANIEFPALHPNFQKFLENYKRDEDYLVLQIHPNAWDSNRFQEFSKIIDYLIAQRVVFLNPFDYYKLTRTEH